MNSVSLKNSDLELHVLNEDYFALKVVNDSSVESTKYVEFCFGDTDLLEFSLDRESNIIKKFLLVLCNHFEVLDMDFCSYTDCESGCISIDLPQHNDCNSFSVRVYRNAVDIVLSNESVKRTIKCGQVLFGLSCDSDLVKVTVIEMAADEVEHTVEELKLGIAND